jgi:cystathionine beta-synthase
VVVEAHGKVGGAIDLMQRYGISQLPVVRGEPADALTDVVGSLQERSLLDRVFRNPDALNEDIAVAMQPPLAAVDSAASIDEVFAELTGAAGGAVLVGHAGRPVAILTRSDLLEFLAAQRTRVEA